MVAMLSVAELLIPLEMSVVMSLAVVWVVFVLAEQMLAVQLLVVLVLLALPMQRVRLLSLHLQRLNRTMGSSCLSLRRLRRLCMRLVLVGSRLWRIRLFCRL